MVLPETLSANLFPERLTISLYKIEQYNNPNSKPHTTTKTTRAHFTPAALLKNTKKFSRLKNKNKTSSGGGGGERPGGAAQDLESAPARGLPGCCVPGGFQNPEAGTGARGVDCSGPGRPRDTIKGGVLGYYPGKDRTFKLNAGRLSRDSTRGGAGGCV